MTIANVFSVRVEPKGLTFAAEASQTLLAAAEAGGVSLPNSCRNGTCRTCICLKTSGEVRYKIEWPGLSLDEKREGYILPCVAIALSDLVIVAPAAKSSPLPPPVPLAVPAPRR